MRLRGRNPFGGRFFRVGLAGTIQILLGSSGSGLTAFASLAGLIEGSIGLLVVLLRVEIGFGWFRHNFVEASWRVGCARHFFILFAFPLRISGGKDLA